LPARAEQVDETPIKRDKDHVRILRCVAGAYGAHCLRHAAFKLCLVRLEGQRYALESEANAAVVSSALLARNSSAMNARPMTKFVRTASSTCSTVDTPSTSESGKIQEFPEVDRAEWFTGEDAKVKILKGHLGFLGEVERTIK